MNAWNPILSKLLVLMFRDVPMHIAALEFIKYAIESTYNTGK